MVQKNPFLKYIMKDKKEDVFHSSVYAKEQNGAGLGAASTESFKVRANINQHRQAVRSYNESKLMTEGVHGGPKAKTYEAPGTGKNKATSNRGVAGRLSNEVANAGSGLARPTGAETSGLARPTFKPNFSIKNK